MGERAHLWDFACLSHRKSYGQTGEGQVKGAKPVYLSWPSRWVRTWSSAREKPAMSPGEDFLLAMTWDLICDGKGCGLSECA